MRSFGSSNDFRDLRVAASLNPHHHLDTNPDANAVDGRPARRWRCGRGSSGDAPFATPRGDGIGEVHD